MPVQRQVGSHVCQPGVHQRREYQAGDEGVPPFIVYAAILTSWMLYAATLAASGLHSNVRHKESELGLCEDEPGDQQPNQRYDTGDGMILNSEPLQQVCKIRYHDRDRLPVLRVRASPLYHEHRRHGFCHRRARSSFDRDRPDSKKPSSRAQISTTRQRRDRWH